MAEILGGLASGIQIADSLLRLAKELRRCIHTVRFAPQEVQRFHGDLSTFAFVLRQFDGTITQRFQDMNNVTEMKEKQNLGKYFRRIIEECTAVKIGFERLLSRFFEDHHRLPSTYGWVYRVQWYFRQNQVAGLRLALESAKSSVTLFMTLDMYGGLVRKVSELKRYKQEVPKNLKRQLRSAKRQLKEQIDVAKDAQRRLEEHQLRTPRSVTPLIEEIPLIIHNTRSVERYATRALAKEESNTKRGYSSPRPAESRIPPSGSVASVQSLNEYQHPSLAQSSSGYLCSDVSDSTIPNPELPFSAPPLRSRNINLPTTPNEVNILDVHNEQNILFKQDSNDEVEVSPQPSIMTDPGIIGHIIHDDGTEVKEEYGRWRGEASQLSVHSNHNAGDAGDTPARLRRTKGKIGKVRWPPRECSDNSEQQDDNANSETMGTNELLWKEGSSPFKAMPPFLDGDFKGIRRRPSK